MFYLRHSLGGSGREARLPSKLGRSALQPPGLVEHAVESILFAQLAFG